MKDWSKKRYWIVGASEGLGLALAQKMSEAGASLILTARNEVRLKEIASTLPNEVEILPLDITDLNAVRKSVKKLENVDGFVFLAGTYWPMPAQHWDIEKLTAMIDVNLIGALHTLDVILPIFMEKIRHCANNDYQSFITWEKFTKQYVKKELMRRRIERKMKNEGRKSQKLRKYIIFKSQIQCFLEENICFTMRDKI